jgi:hypothetical protein
MLCGCSAHYLEPGQSSSNSEQSVGWMMQGSIPCRPRDFCLCQMSRPALFPTEPLTKLMRGVLYQGVNHSGHEADHSPSLISKLAVSGAVPVLPLCVHMVCTETTLPLPFLCCLGLLFELWSLHNVEWDRKPIIGSL